MTKFKKSNLSLLKRATLLLVVICFMSGFVLPSASTTASAAAPSSYTNITADSTAYVSITNSNSSKYFKFVPTLSGTYKFYSTNYSGDPKASLLDNYGEELTTNDDSSDRNFSISYECVAYNTYYIKAYMYSSYTGSYTLNVATVSISSTPSAPSVPSGSEVDVNEANGKNYSLFNSGRTTSSGYDASLSYNPAPETYDNTGYDLRGSVSGSNSRFRLGLSFTVNVDISEQCSLAIRAWDVDESTRGCSYGYEYDFVYLVDETTNTSTKLDAHLSGQDDVWTNSEITIAPSLFTTGHTYHFELQMTCTGNHSCSYYSVTVRTVNLIVNGSSAPSTTPQSGISDAEISASISNSGVVSTALTASAYAQESYNLEYKAVYVSSTAQYGGKESSATINTTSGVINDSFSLESGAPRGTYTVTVFIKDLNNNVIASRTATASYGYSAVSYNSNGGSQNLPTDGTSYNSGDTVTVMFNYVPSLYGYTFLGWSTDRYATQPTYTENGTNTFVIGSSDVTLYAIWGASSCNHEFVGGTCIHCGEEEQQVSYDEWDGGVDTSWYSSYASEFTIYSAEQLAGLAYLVNNGNTFSGKTIELANNIDLANREWTPIGKGDLTSEVGTSGCTFNGTFNGNYYKIFNLYITSNNTTYQGLFGDVDGATIKNLGLEDAYVNVSISGSARSKAGALVGRISDTTIENCYASNAQVSTFTVSNPSSAGGLIGNVLNRNSYGSVIENCYVTGTVISNGHASLLIGSSYSGNNVYIRKCYASGSIQNQGSKPGDTFVCTGGIIGCRSGSVNNNINDSFFSGSMVSTSNNKGSLVGESSGCSVVNSYYNISNSVDYYQGTSTSISNLQSQTWLTSNLGWDFNNVWEFRANSEYPVLKGFASGNGGSSVHQHNYVETAREEATCDGYGVSYLTCSCGDSKVELIEPLQHDYQITEELEPTCTEDGFITFECQNANCTAVKQQILERYGHYYGGDNECDYCGHTIEIHTHDYTTEVVDPTCSAMGYTEYTCTCGYSYRDNYLEPARHNWNEGEVTLEPTCEVDGVTLFTCQTCYATKTMIIEASHDWSEEVVTEKTCTTDGVISKVCSVCYAEEVEIIPAGHNFDEGEEITPATCETAGEAQLTCLDCSYEEVVEIPALGHQYENGVCIRCGEGFIENITPSVHPIYGMYFEIDDILSDYGPSLIDEYGLMLDYNSDATLEKVAVYLTQDGTMWRRCIAVKGTNIEYATYVPYLSYQSDIKYTGLNHDWINIFRLRENAKGVWCYNDFVTIGVNLQDAYGNLLLSLYDIGQAGAETRIFDNLDYMKAWLYDECSDHVETDWIVDVEPTCVAGSRHKQCIICEEITTTEDIPAVDGHEPGDWIVDVEPTAMQTGLRHKECNNCSTITETEVMPTLATIVIDSVEVSAGATVEITVNIQNNPGILGAVLNLEFDSELVLISAETGTAWRMLNYTAPSYLENDCSFVWDGTSADATNGSIIVLTFEVPSYAEVGYEYYVNMYYTDGNIRNEDLEGINVSIEEGYVTVISTVDEVNVGDVNSDGVVDVADVITLRRFLAGYEIEIDELAADLDSDNQITIADVILLRRYLVD